jgi:hypothetical protein
VGVRVLPSLYGEVLERLVGSIARLQRESLRKFEVALRNRSKQRGHLEETFVKFIQCSSVGMSCRMSVQIRRRIGLVHASVAPPIVYMHVHRWTAGIDAHQMFVTGTASEKLYQDDSQQQRV